MQAVLLADAVAAHPDDPAGRAVAYEEACRAQVEPWFDLAVQTDAAGSDPTGFAADAPPSPQARAMTALFVRGRPTRSSAGRWPACGTCWPCPPTWPPTRWSPAACSRSCPTPTPTPRPRGKARHRAELLAALTTDQETTAHA